MLWNVPYFSHILLDISGEQQFSYLTDTQVNWHLNTLLIEKYKVIESIYLQFNVISVVSSSKCILFFEMKASKPPEHSSWSIRSVANSTIAISAIQLIKFGILTLEEKNHELVS